MIKNSFRTLFAVGALAISGTASASILTADYSWDGQGSVTAGGATISACNEANAGECSSPGTIGAKYIPDVGAGVGVRGVRDNEIDWYTNGERSNSEMLRFTFGTASFIDSLQLGLLFDGPEYADYQERARFRVTYENGSSATYTLATLFGTNGQATWNGFGSWQGTGLGHDGSGLWTGINPFGSNAVTQIDMFAVAGTCGAGLFCLNQSDFVFRSMQATAVPEPTTLALLGAGLLMMGAAMRRRTATAAK